MKLRGIGAAGAVVVVALCAAACEQPRIDCRTARGSFAATYSLKEGAGACSELKGELLGVQSYYPELDETRMVDLSRAFLAIRTAKIGQLDAVAREHEVTLAGPLHSMGEFAAMSPDASGICSVPLLSAADVNLPEILPRGDPKHKDTYDPGHPAAHINYAWSDVRVVVTPDRPGTQMTADLTYSENGCTATYRVVGLWPAVRCEKLAVDESGNVVGLKQPEDSLCGGEPHPGPPYHRDRGSGINPDFKVHCDPTLFYCVLDEAP